MQKQDYIQAKISTTSFDNKTKLKTLLNKKKLLGPNNFILTLNQEKISNKGYVSNFAFGKTGFKYSYLTNPNLNNFALTTDIITNLNPLPSNNNDSCFIPYLESMRETITIEEVTENKEKKKVGISKTYDKAGMRTLLSNKLACSIPTVLGMSGGPVFECLFEVNNIGCKVIGVLSGSNLVHRKAQRGGGVTFEALVSIKK